MSGMHGTGWKLWPSLALAAALAGCGGSGNETSSTAPPTAVDGTEAPGKVAREVTGDKSTTGEPVMPVRQVDPKHLVDVVKGDVTGGEAAAGGSPENILWLPPDLKLVKDEPFTVEVPKGLQPLTAFIPSANPLTKAKVELGRQLYFEPRVSLNGTVSCGTCHNPEKGWTDNLKTSVGIDGQVGGRSAPTVLNSVYGRSMFWDGRALSLEGQAQGPPQNPIEMGKQSYQDIVERLRKVSGYREQFQKVFGTDVTLDGMVKAIAAFERAFALSGNSAYDKYNAGDMKALSDSQKRGMVLFGLRLSEDDDFKTDVVLKKADCTSCHAGFNFTDELFHNLGIGWDPKTGKYADLGRFIIAPVGAKNPTEYAAFKTPTVRDAARTAPYMHDGSLATLEEVVEHYNKGGNPNPALDKDIKKLNLTAQEKADVVEFMKALTGEPIKVALPTLPAGPDGKTPNPADALNTPGPKTAQAGVFHPGLVR
jgi:cytochrome c peroxidase